MPLLRSGQGESAFKAFARSKRIWVVNDMMPLYKKGKGTGEMASAFTDELLGWGLKLPAAALQKINACLLSSSRHGRLWRRVQGSCTCGTAHVCGGHTTASLSKWRQ